MTLIPFNFSFDAQHSLEGHERFFLAPASHTTTARVTYQADIRHIPTKTDVHPANRSVKKSEVASAGGNSLNALKGGKCTPHGIFSTSKIYTKEF